MAIKVGLIGCGGIAPVHLDVYKKLDREVEVTALCDINLERAKKLANRFKVRKVFSNYWEMLEKSQLDLVDVCTPISTHAEIVCDVAKVVPAILVEKPMALTVSQCDEMIKTVKKYGGKLCIGHNQIFSPHIQKVKIMVDSGAFNLLSLETTLKGNFDVLLKHGLVSKLNVSPEQRGVIWEVCCHHAYLQLYFLPNIKEVYAAGGKFKYPVYDDFAVLLRASDDRFGVIRISWICDAFDVVYEFTSADGKRIDILWEFDCMLEKSDTPPFNFYLAAKNFLVDEKRILKKWLRFGVRYLRNRKILPTFYLIQRYIEAIKADLPPPVTPEEGRKTVVLLEAVEKSLDTRSPVRID
ncbi:Gfo/Idh/MocA family oxidoreductase [Candidatus Bathyarchaeota archaeon]|nr:Gfo/Idh/MocA family oxidoreductase [Candidatus Bathyarchaeota archaeon]